MILSILFTQVLNLVNLPGNPIDTPNAFIEANHYFKEVGITFRPKYLTQITESCPNDNVDFLSRFSQLECLANEAKRLDLINKRKKAVTYFFVSGWHTGSNQFVYGGTALGVCGHVAMGTGALVIPDLISNTKMTGTIMAHEVFHLMCATHTEPWTDLSLMSSHATRFWKPQEFIPVLSITKRQVKRWYVRGRKL